MMTSFAELALLLVRAAAIGLFGILLRQPLIVSFIAVGLIAGPSALDVVHSDAQIDLLSELGLAALLFVVGIKLDVKLVRSLGKVALLTVLGQVMFTSVFGYLIGLALGLGSVTSLYVAVALTFSSTIIIVKLLSDKREIDSLHGQIALPARGIGSALVLPSVNIAAMNLHLAVTRSSGSRRPCRHHNRRRGLASTGRRPRRRRQQQPAALATVFAVFAVFAGVESGREHLAIPPPELSRQPRL